MLEPDPTESLRSRLATENLLAQKKRELATANTRIAERAKVLTDEVIERRNEANAARSEAARIKDKHLEAVGNLRKAKSETMIAERRLWTSLETISDGFAVFDRDMRIVAANASFFQPYEDLECVGLGITYPELVHIAAEEGLIDPGEMRPAEWAIWMKDRWAPQSIQPTTIRFWNNQFIRLTERRTVDGDVVMMGMNITRHIRRQKALEAAHHNAEAANRAKSAFLANMSHEIRTPMNGVLAMADLIAEGDLSEDQRVCLDTIRSSGEALLVIINDVLDYSKIEAQKLTISYETFDLEETIYDVTTLLLPTAREKSVSLVVDYDMFLPTSFDGDKGRIRQILMNLVGNAVKFTPEGHVLVRVVGLPDTKPDHYRLHITIEDTGIGIPAEKREHIFGEFNQVQSESTRQFDGTGLGLAITRRLVELMGGEMWVDDGVEKGSVFGFRLTLRREGPDTEGLRGRFGKRRLFLCDPNPTSREVMSKQMMALGLRPKAVGDPEDPDIQTPDPDDLVILCEDHGLHGEVKISLGPPRPNAGVVIHRPILREALLDALTEVTKQAASDPTLGTEIEPVISEATTNTVPFPVPAPDLDVAAISETSHKPDEVTPIDAPTLEVAAEAAPQPDVAPPTPRPEPALRRVRVLAAEDNKTNRLVLTRLLKTLDIDLEIVENGQLAVERFIEDPPDIVFTDISMPEMDGKAAARAIRTHMAKNDLAPVPIVAMTAHAVSGDERDILAAGIDFYMTKPLRKDALIEHILAAAPEEAIPPLSPDT